MKMTRWGSLPEWSSLHGLWRFPLSGNLIWYSKVIRRNTQKKYSSFNSLCWLYFRSLTFFFPFPFSSSITVAGGGVGSTHSEADA
jgi:hypothetical protein